MKIMHDITSSKLSKPKTRGKIPKHMNDAGTINYIHSKSFMYYVMQYEQNIIYTLKQNFINYILLGQDSAGLFPDFFLFFFFDLAAPSAFPDSSIDLFSGAITTSTTGIASFAGASFLRFFLSFLDRACSHSPGKQIRNTVSEVVSNMECALYLHKHAGFRSSPVYVSWANAGCSADLNPNTNTSTAHINTTPIGKAYWVLTTSDNSILQKIQNVHVNNLIIHLPDDHR
ncbi:hypothetical protein C0J52_12271 [Blattella germanica]|nr:hypothetical protein C0J52_12271 [Blattella germanica]